MVKLLQDPSILRYLEVVGHVVAARQVLLLLDGLAVLPLVITLVVEVVVVVGLEVVVLVVVVLGVVVVLVVVALGVVLLVVVVFGVVVVLVVVALVVLVVVALRDCRRLTSVSSLVKLILFD